jgi:hypothetical protein
VKPAVGAPLAATALAWGLLALGCSRDKEDAAPRVVSLQPTIPIREAGAGVTAASANRPSPDYGWRGDVDAASHPFQIIVTKTVTTEAGAAPAKPPNPDDAVLERVRLAAGGCFQTLPGYVPQRSAHVVLTVISTGTVSRADVSSPDTDDATVIDCIRSQALSTTFSDNANGPLRTYAIDVRVTAGGASGGR